MSGIWIALIVLVVVVGVAAALLGAANRTDTTSATSSPTLGREAIKKDKAARKADPQQVVQPPTGKEFESVAVAPVSADIEPAEASLAPAPWVQPDAEQIGASRRAFLNRSIVALMGLGIAGFAAAAFPAFLWPSSSGGFGSKIRVGKVSDVEADVSANNGFLYKPEGRMWITLYPAAALPKAEKTYSEPELAGMRAGLVALYQKCPHLGCRVPSCDSSQWFECPCHGSQYNQVGEKKGGPAPRGMDHFATEISGGEYVVNTGAVIQGPPIGTNTTGQEAEGPNCIGASEEH